MFENVHQRRVMQAKFDHIIPCLQMYRYGVRSVGKTIPQIGELGNCHDQEGNGGRTINSGGLYGLG